ncbi:hypothetical protein SEVIR_9G478550v4 [Setaria viridis]
MAAVPTRHPRRNGTRRGPRVSLPVAGGIGRAVGRRGQSGVPFRNSALTRATPAASVSAARFTGFGAFHGWVGAPRAGSVTFRFRPDRLRDHKPTRVVVRQAYHKQTDVGGQTAVAQHEQHSQQGCVSRGRELSLSSGKSWCGGGGFCARFARKTEKGRVLIRPAGRGNGKNPAWQIWQDGGGRCRAGGGGRRCDDGLARCCGNGEARAGFACGAILFPRLLKVHGTVPKLFLFGAVERDGGLLIAY